MTVIAEFLPPEPVVLDYAGAADLSPLLDNLSGVAADGRMLWTVSDEGRTVERLQERGGGYVLAEQLSLDRLFPGLPPGKEGDLETIDVAGGRVWVCGSHCRVRRKPRDGAALNSGFRRRPSRHLLGAFPASVGPSGTGTALPFLGDGSLRRRLRADPFLSAFMNLPSKENGLDIEGVVVQRRRLLVGLRGPVIDSCAVVMELGLARDGTPSDADPIRHVLKLDGLGIRDLARWDDDILVLAGPVTAADGPFRIYQWRPRPTSEPEAAQCVHSWPLGSEHPEGLCRLAREGQDGVLVVYDSPAKTRVAGTRYTADWFGVKIRG